jgi:BirA family biotin operon repressor/biotin-[acetyl-CoA-carboxylase] ligase
LYKIFEDTEFVGKKMVFLPKCHSTNDIAAELLNKGLIGSGTIVITDHQTAGRGQRGNKWEAAPGLNLTFSVVLEPNFLKIEQNFYLNIVASLAITDALMNYDNNFLVKWPNDIYYGNQKAGGILIENSIQTEKILTTVIGIGMNVNQAHFEESEDAISLFQIFGRTFNLNDLMNRIIHCMDRRWKSLYRKQLSKLKQDYLHRMYGFHKLGLFQTNNGIIRGMIQGIDPIGRLEVDVDGIIYKFNFQEIIFLK